MPSSSTKLKTLYIMQALLDRTDQDHGMSAADLIGMLNSHGLSADRKTIYSDIETLQEFGLDIVRGSSGYYIASREFELPELKLLVDAVQASKFITVKKSRELIKKIEKLAGKNGASQLQRDIYIFNRPKTGNETIYYTVDQIHSALLSNRQIRFQYLEWTIRKELTAKRDGEYYEVSPWALTWDDENYYLIAYEHRSQQIRHYRVDKMQKTAVAAEERLGKAEFDDFDLAEFAKKTFGMYGGYDEQVDLVCDRSMVGVILDRFSAETILIPEGDDRFRISVPVSVSPQFFGWVAGLGGGVKIDGPKKVQEEYKMFLQKILKQYSDR